MLEQVSTSVKFLAFYTASKQGKTGLTVTIDIYNPSGTQIVTAGSATALGGGLYSYTLSTNNSSEGEYAAIFKTTDSTVDAQHIPSLWVLGRAGVENLDAATSTRLASSGYTAPANSDISAIKSKTDNLPSDPADQSLVESAITALSIPTVVQIRSELDSNSTKLANLDATVSSRLAPSGTLATVTTLTNAPTVPTAAAIATQVRSELSVELGRVDAAVSTRLATSGYTAPSTAPTAAANASAVRTELATELARVDATVSSRLASSAYTAPTSAPTAAAVASAVRTELTEISNLDATVSSRLASSAYSAAPTTAQIATAVEGSLLNEADGQAVLNAIVGAIGNTNLSEVSIVAAVRADLERVGGKIDSIPAAPTAAANATAVWATASKTITGGTVDTLTNSPSVPSAASIASATRSELAVELARVDASVSSRLAGSSYTAPANSDITAIKAKSDLLNTDRLANVATTAIVGNLIAQANS